MNFIKLKFFFGIVFIVITETYPRAQGTLITGNPFYLTYDLIHYALCTHDPGVAFFALDLVNDKGNPVIQQKLKTEQGRFSGAMNLKHDMPTGIYWIRAYSAATGLSENSVCYCPVVIINPDDLAGNRWKKIILNPAGKISFHFLNPADPTAGAGDYQALLSMTPEK